MTEAWLSSAANPEMDLLQRGPWPSLRSTCPGALAGQGATTLAEPRTTPGVGRLASSFELSSSARASWER